MTEILEKLFSPGSSPVVSLAIVAILFGFFLLISGLSIIKIDKVTVAPGRKTWITGLGVMVFGLLLLLTVPGTVAEPDPDSSSTATAKAAEAITSEPTVAATTALPDAPTPAATQMTAQPSNSPFFTWNKIAYSLPANFEHPKGVYDPERGTIVIFSKILEENESQTWEFNGYTWRRTITSNDPPYRFNHTLVYDPDRKVVVLFGGTQQDGSVELNDTWEYNGLDWKQIETKNKPVSRDLHYMYYDSCRKQIMLFGGTDNDAYSVPDLWAYDGYDWKRQSQIGTPPPVWLAGVAFDESRCRLVLFGGEPANHIALSETWVLNGTTWSRLNTPAAPPARWGHMMLYDPNLKQVLLFGGYGERYPEGDDQNDLWVLDNDTWRQETTETTPSPREQNAFVYDSYTKCSVLISGHHDLDMWVLCPIALATAGYQPRAVPPTAEPVVTSTQYVWTPIHGSLPAAFEWPEAVYDRQRDIIVVFSKMGGRNENQTWEYDGTTWLQRITTHFPTYRTNYALAYDDDRNVVVLFGGAQQGKKLNDTWEYDGVDWKQVDTQIKPASRDVHYMFYDSCHRRMMMFGGEEEGLFFDPQLWRYDGSNWTLEEQVGTPPPVHWAGIAFDDERCQLVFFGGLTSSLTGSPETWALNDNTWSLLDTPATLLPRWSSMMTYDSDRQQVLLFGGTGEDDDIRLSDLWVFDGNTWQQQSTIFGPSAREQNAFIYNPSIGCIVLIADQGDMDMWKLCAG